MMQSFILMAVVTVIWALVGYSLAFGGDSAFLGDLRFALLNNVGSVPNPDYAPTIPQQTFMIYQLMFAIITPALICGAFAERMKFSAMLLFMVLWSLLVYFPQAHMVWGKGGFLSASLGGKIPCFDFAGGTVVHITSGVSALVCALYLGKRLGFPSDSMKPHNLVISFIGACLLWVGWFGFNAGSALAASGLASDGLIEHLRGVRLAGLSRLNLNQLHPKFEPPRLQMLTDKSGSRFQPPAAPAFRNASPHEPRCGSDTRRSLRARVGSRHSWQ
jgi:Amt family ammonium transporter